MLDRIKNFKELQLGMFVHFGLYSIVGKGEWYMHNENIEPKAYEKLMNDFKVNRSWAKSLIRTAKSFGAKYIVITTRHHDGFSLYDTCGLTDYDVMHTPTKRDLIKEFVDECNKNDILPFFYHTLIDWHDDRFKSDTKAYFDYLIKSITFLCENYGKVGGFWFDGTWNDPNFNWHLDDIFKVIRKLQPESIISNNGGLEAPGQIIHSEIDCIVYEKASSTINSKSFDNKLRAKEVCQTLNSHWGFYKSDKNYKTAQELKNMFDECKENCANLLLNVGPKQNGKVMANERLLLKSFYKLTDKY